ncbi:cellulose biosynthesis protein BcsC [Pusillimonas sp.]|uniref:cellulose biosynthesis protein BcsC n=1 Tax=Pusillimonas sp. TaxID=3040095 RepID=UPI0029BB9262|nr:cellulose synthase subunit BcsC-related outer membrane protein [Pusillimonas sp.]MDX3895524.1 cellulose synthase subunit BcsC-related outer membrane protein [Pusillimonas sp.]
MRRYNRLVCGLLAALLHHAGWADQNEAHQALIDQGNFWMARDDGQRAAEAWNKLLLASPENPQALYGLAHVELKANRLAQARAYLQRLQRIQPNGGLAAKLEQEIALGSGSGAASIEEARRLAASGKLDEAVAKYRQVLGSQEPVGDIGREYYTYLGYTDGGLPQAIVGLRKLAEQSPRDARIQLALARHLARNQPTRIEGVRSLAKLSTDPDVGEQATQSWREALTWTTPTQAGARALFDDYLKARPDDAEIRRQLQRGVAQAEQQAARSQQQATRVDPLRQRTDTAMKWLESGDTARARAEFQAILAERPNYADALGGLGVAAMRERDWQQAKDYLSRARRGNAAWKASLDSVQYWVDVDKAQALLGSGNVAEARKLAARAAKREPKETAADVLLADILLEEGKTSQAVQAYRNILSRRPGDAQALQGLSRVARGSGDYAGARRMLEDALAQDPEDPWLRYQLAKLYQSEGHTKEARGLLDGLLMTRPNDPEALYATALLASDDQQWQAVRDLLARIPAERRTAPMNQLYAKADLQAQIAQAVAMADAGRKQEALNLLGQVRASAGNDFDTLNAVAQAYVQIGEAPRGLALLQPLRAQGQARSTDASIAYAGLLLASKQDVEASIVLRHLHTQNLTSSQRASLDDLTDAYRIRQADLLAERRDLVAAYDMLAPVLQKRPNDPGAMAALARMYAAAGQGDQAMQMYETLLRSDPDNPNLHLGLAQVAQQLKNNRQAERSADAAVSLAPENIDVLTAAARIYRVSGKSGDAAELLNRALALQGGATSGVPVPQYAAGYAATSSANPFVGLPGQRTSSALDGGRSVAVAPAGAAVAYPMGTTAQPPVQAYPAASQGVYDSVPPPASAAAAAPQAAYAAQTGYPAQASVPAQTPYYAAVPAGAASFAPAYPVAADQSANPFADPRAVAYAPQSELARELAAINEERSPYLTAGTEFRTRNGEAGTSKLEEFKMPLEASMPAGNGRVKVQLTPITVGSGSQGDLPALAPPPAGMEIARLNPYAIDNKTQTGIGMSVGYQTSGMELDAGVTPLGFQETDFTGGALFQGTLDDAGTVNGRIDVSRRPVTDSVLSFAGRRYKDEDLEWGGVSATGARVTLSKDFGQAGVYGAAAWHTLRGNNVESNSRREFNVGTYFHLIDEADSRLTAGVNVNAAFYDKNLGQYTFGHGGYFSPQNYYALSVPVTWAQRSGRMSYRVDGAIGVQSFKEDDAPVFPTRSDLQARAQRSDIPTQYGLHNGTYPGQSKTGVAYNLKASAEYRLDPQLALGATLGADNANDYKQWMGGFYLRYYFHPQGSLLDLPIEPVRSPYGNTFGR